MKAYKVSNEYDKLTLEEKLDLLNTYEVEDLIHVVKEYQHHPKRYDIKIAESVINKLKDNGIIV